MDRTQRLILDRDSAIICNRQSSASPESSASLDPVKDDQTDLVAYAVMAALKLVPTSLI
jgi:hypothetical protein